MIFEIEVITCNHCHNQFTANDRLVMEQSAGKEGLICPWCGTENGEKNK